MAGKNAKKATSTSNKISPNKLPEIKPELVTLSQLVRYNPQQASSQNNPSSSRMVPLGKPVQSSSEYHSRYPPILLFCFKYKVPWIVKWSYQIKENILIRNHAVKWWDNFI